MGGEAQDRDFRSVLRALPVFAAISEPTEGLDLPDDPLAGIRAWLLDAVDAGQPEPHAMTLATFDPTSGPSTRVLLCKDVDDVGVYFATSLLSRKSREIEVDLRVAASFYWSATGRQIRITGVAAAGDRGTGARDFAERGRSSQLAARLPHDRELRSHTQLADAFGEVARQFPGAVPAPTDWRLFRIEPDTVEFWQASVDRLHVRVRFVSREGRWVRELLWP
jgi:pyridoxamine 5'-phosphate oxidase